MWKYDYNVPESKRVRLLVHTDCANEADDQYALAHILMTPKFDVRGIIAAHFDAVTSNGWSDREPGTTAAASMEEVDRVLECMGLSGAYPTALGAAYALADERTPQCSDGVEMIIAEAMREDERPLFIGCQGSLTDLASAILCKPEICSRMTAIWIGGGDYPEGGMEFNLMQDIHAANVVFSSDMPVWQIPMKAYKTLAVSLAELQLKVKPCGRIGEYLFRNLVELNTSLAEIAHWPHGELWGLGDQGIVAVLMQESGRRDNYSVVPAPRVDTGTMRYIHDGKNRGIRVYDSVDYRLTLEDFFAKLAINYQK